MATEVERPFEIGVIRALETCFGLFETAVPDAHVLVQSDEEYGREAQQNSMDSPDEGCLLSARASFEMALLDAEAHAVEHTLLTDKLAIDMGTILVQPTGAPTDNDIERLRQELLHYEITGFHAERFGRAGLASTVLMIMDVVSKAAVASRGPVAAARSDASAATPPTPSTVAAAVATPSVHAACEPGSTSVCVCGSREHGPTSPSSPVSPARPSSASGRCRPMATGLQHDGPQRTLGNAAKHVVFCKADVGRRLIIRGDEVTVDGRPRVCDWGNARHHDVHDLVIVEVHERHKGLVTLEDKTTFQNPPPGLEQYLPGGAGLRGRIMSRGF